MRHNSELKHDVLADLHWTQRKAAEHICVSASDGIISLSGYVECLKEKQAVEVAVRRVWGVKGIAEAIEVRSPLLIEKRQERTGSNAANRNPAKGAPTEEWVTITVKVNPNYESEAAGDLTPLFAYSSLISGLSTSGRTGEWTTVAKVRIVSSELSLGLGNLRELLGDLLEQPTKKIAA